MKKGSPRRGKLHLGRLHRGPEASDSLWRQRKRADRGVRPYERGGTMINIKNPREYIEQFLYIRDKRQKLVPLVMKPAQKRLYEAIKAEHRAGRPPRFIILKARQQGFSTVTEALMFHDAATRPMVRTLIVAHQEDSTASLFKMNKLFYDNLPACLRPMRKNSNAKELVFENPTRDGAEKEANPGLRSQVRCVTAGGSGIGRGDTVTNAHLSELAFWPGEPIETLNGILQSVPNDPDTLVVIESTANGYNAFKELWDGAVAGTNAFRPLFFPWYEEPEYTMEPPADFTRTADEEALAEAYGLTDGQLCWRRWCIATNCAGKVELFRQEYPSCPEEAFLFSGTPFFDNSALQLRLAQAPEPESVGQMRYALTDKGACPEEWEWQETQGGCVKIWEKPQPGHPYVLGGDPAGDGSDRYIAKIIDNSTGETAAVLRFTTGDIEYSRQVYALGRWYNDALVGIEVNFNTYVSKKLEEWDYPNLYVREEKPDTYTHKPLKKFGWRTDSATRPVILSELQTIAATHPDWFRDADELREMQHFIYNEQRRPEAEAGEHDDYVMASAICYAIRSQQSYAVAASSRKAKWRDDQWEDYRNASASGKRHLLEIWGDPYGN